MRGLKAYITHLFIEQFYGDLDTLHVELKRDWWEVQYNWSCFIDALCKNGNITQEQYHNWTFPWPR